MDEKGFDEEYKLIRKIINYKRYTNNCDEYIDDLLTLYDNDEICRGSFKTCMWFLVEETKKICNKEGK